MEVRSTSPHEDPAAFAARELRAIAEVDARLFAVSRHARILPSLAAKNAAEERARLLDALRRGEHAEPRWELAPRRVDPSVWRALFEARVLAEQVVPPPLASLFAARAEELELDLAIVDAIGKPTQLRPLVRRRYGSGATRVPAAEGGFAPLSTLAERMLETIAPREEPRELPAEGARGSMASAFRGAARAAGLALEVRLDPRLVAGAATGDRAVFVAPRAFGRTERRRLVAHEILGHAVAAANARAQPLRLLEAGTAGSFADQEGVAIALEQRAGAVDPSRARTLAARVISTDLVHRGASFAETARWLVVEHGFSWEAAIVLAERGHRGGGVARDASYLAGWLRVEAAIARGEADLELLRAGRVGLEGLPALRAAIAAGLLRGPVSVPSLEGVLAAAEDDA